MNSNPLFPAPGRPDGFSLSLLAISLFLAGGGFLWRGFDFTLAVLIGSLIVGLNYLWNRKVFRGLLLADNPRSRARLSYAAKLGLTVVVIYVAVQQFRIDPLGILLGVSSLPAACLLFAFSKRGTKKLRQG